MKSVILALLIALIVSTINAAAIMPEDNKLQKRCHISTPYGGTAKSPFKNCWDSPYTSTKTIPISSITTTTKTTSTKVIPTTTTTTSTKTIPTKTIPTTTTTTTSTKTIPTKTIPTTTTTTTSTKTIPTKTIPTTTTSTTSTTSTKTIPTKTIPTTTTSTTSTKTIPTKTIPTTTTSTTSTTSTKTIPTKTIPTTTTTTTTTTTFTKTIPTTTTTTTTTTKKICPTSGVQIHVSLECQKLGGVIYSKDNGNCGVDYVCFIPCTKSISTTKQISSTKNISTTKNISSTKIISTTKNISSTKIISTTTKIVPKTNTKTVDLNKRCGEYYYDSSPSGSDSSSGTKTIPRKTTPSFQHCILPTTRPVPTTTTTTTTPVSAPTTTGEQVVINGQSYCLCKINDEFVTDMNKCEEEASKYGYVKSTDVTDTCIPVTLTVTEKVKETITQKETVTVTITEDPTPTVQCASKYQQCGGIGFNGPTCCQSGSCQKLSDYYSQCL